MDSSPRSGRTPSRNSALRHGSEATNNAEWQQHPRRKDGALATRRPHRHYRAFRCQETSHARRQPLHRGDCQAPAVPCHALARWDGNASPLPPPPSRLASDERDAATDRQRPPRSRCGGRTVSKTFPARQRRRATRGNGDGQHAGQQARLLCTAFRARRGLRSPRQARTRADRQHRTYNANKMPRRRRCQAKLRFALQSLRSGSTSPHEKKQPGRHAAQAPAAQTPAQARRRRAPAPMTGLARCSQKKHSDWPQRTEATPSLHGGQTSKRSTEPRNHSRRPTQLQHEGVALHVGRSWR
ncbi:hypothetical protein, conserved in T.vivax [Trypanosoma vivax Y486]|uniref:Uncharacterized protein n=1 Tax=Trypanosoma vivax (strain Y486) TaxID=1055687 RepID=F9WQF3_TRYVY|nr:hypothetical protein, conserved in T.vivax [Trypanosoma vivax Y486]|eukprot:CCD19781.1 hypothetical protein, conserved in T.vivax [Trypanosoma vivax Y486]